MNRYLNNSGDQPWVIALTVAILSAAAGTVLAQDVAHYVGTNSCAAANCPGGWSAASGPCSRRESCGATSLMTSEF